MDWNLISSSDFLYAGFIFVCITVVSLFVWGESILYAIKSSFTELSIGQAICSASMFCIALIYWLKFKFYGVRCCNCKAPFNKANKSKYRTRKGFVPPEVVPEIAKSSVSFKDVEKLSNVTCDQCTASLAALSTLEKEWFKVLQGIEVERTKIKNIARIFASNGLKCTDLISVNERDLIKFRIDFGSTKRILTHIYELRKSTQETEKIVIVDREEDEE